MELINFLRNKKLILILILLIIFIIIFSFFILIRNNNKKNQKLGDISFSEKNYSKIQNSIFRRKEVDDNILKDEKHQEVKKEENKSLNIINKTVSLGGKEIIPGTNNKMIYPIGIACQNNQCQNQPKDKQLTIPFIWVALQFYKINGNKDFLFLVKDNINYIVDQNLQPNFWHCKFLREMTEMKEMKEDEDKLKKICQSTVLLFFTEINNYSQDVDINNFAYEEIKDEIEGKSLTIKKNNIFLPQNISDFVIFSSYITDLVTKYQWFNSPSSLYLAKGYFDSALRYYINNKNEQRLTGLPLLAIGSFYLYDATLNRNYYDLAFYLANRALILNKESVQNLLYVSFLDEELYKRTNNKVYLEDLKNVLDYLEKNFYDSKMNLIYRTKSTDYTYYDFLDNVFYAYFYNKYKK